MKKFAIFGCGVYGRRTLKEMGGEVVNCFIDNDPKKYGLCINGLPVIGLNDYIKDKRDEQIIIPASSYYSEVKSQLISNGIKTWKIYRPAKNIGVEDTLIVNPYKTADNISYDITTTKERRELIRDYTTQLLDEKTLFDSIEIETYNRCNGVCEFCPVSVQNEIRDEKFMEKELFEKIINELAELNYRGKISLFSNNEPFMDERIIELQKYAREKMPDAYFYLYTNGTLLTLDKFIEIISVLDELLIDNYNQQLDLIPNVKKIVEYCNNRDELKRKVTIMLRKPKEILTSRGGDAPNVEITQELYARDSCILPFKQLIIRPDGKISLCCNDPLGKYTMGDLTCQSIMEVWNGEKYRGLREKIVRGRENISKCKKCDVFIF